ncbi:flavodoxin family protein [Christensenellaceae bacterium OttesenSCG-928-L17]|nr:flavodoxin family protein [Christensenellaceae bacterium OttesenSCG-928-L17]
MSKIVVLNGSPRKNGNTSKLVSAFVKGAEASGHQVTTFSVQDTKVSGCMGCDYCVRNGGKCVQNDGMQAINAALMEADTIVFASPSYYFGWTAQLKAIVDRFYAASEKYPITSAAMLVALGGDAKTDAAAAFENYKSVINYLAWQDKGTVIVGGVMERDDIVGNPGLLEAEKLGRNI